MIQTIKYWLKCIREYPLIKQEMVDLISDNDNLLFRIELLTKEKGCSESIKTTKKQQIFYSAPSSKLVTEYLRYYQCTEVDSIVSELIEKNDCTDLDNVPLIVMKWLHNKFLNNEFRYVNDKGEQWERPELTLNNKAGDCDSWGIVIYYIIREMFYVLGVWDKCKDRLFCNVGNLNKRGPYYAPLEAHFYLSWKSFKDGEEFIIESTGHRGMAIVDWLTKPAKDNPCYGVIWFTFNDHYSTYRNWFIQKINEVK